MNTYLAADTIRTLREARALTQRELATAVGVTDKAVSKWESGRGLPDISLIEGLAAALGVSVAELLSGDVRQNANRAGNMARSRFYVCPICGNVVHAMGEGSFSCCGSQLLPQEAETPDDAHAFTIERIEDDWYVTLDHPMTKQHFISFAAYVTTDGLHLKKLYPEMQAQARFHITGPGTIYLFCNRHGLFAQRTPKIARPSSAGKLPAPR
ncbi:helix-turn-helix domain-containing protein [Collinsella sp. UBA1693]|uniref:helix-turn-helix domain-containing protein n=1 Tax=Collinsella sp. UBA1693 TaxID=1946385 RepID=UPI00257B1C60|nr:helix-turn-helix domain-containing protein [Collinsella sp. UBA1693]